MTSAPARSLLATTLSLAVAWASPSAPALAQPASPRAPSPAAGKSASPVAARTPDGPRAVTPSRQTTGEPDEIPSRWREDADAVLNRRFEEPEPVALRLGRFVTRPWPQIRVHQISPGEGGLVLRIEDDPREYRVGDTIGAARIVRLVPGEVTMELDGDRRRFFGTKAFPTITVRAIRQFEGSLTALLDSDKRAYYPGDVYRETRIQRIEPDGVTFTYGTESRKIAAPYERPPFPLIAFTGIVDMGEGRAVFIHGNKNPFRVGDMIDGARVVDISPTHVTLEFEGERRAMPVR